MILGRCSLSIFCSRVIPLNPESIDSRLTFLFRNRLLVPNAIQLRVEGPGFRRRALSGERGIWAFDTSHTWPGMGRGKSNGGTSSRRISSGRSCRRTGTECSDQERQLLYRGTPLLRKRTPLGPYRRPVPSFPGGGHDRRDVISQNLDRAAGT